MIQDLYKLRLISTQYASDFLLRNYPNLFFPWEVYSDNQESYMGNIDDVLRLSHSHYYFHLRYWYIINTRTNRECKIEEVLEDPNVKNEDLEAIIFHLDVLRELIK